ncbi:hypothetical protein AALB39_13865 [Lachnospiraceae bacterium 54-53]
MIENQKKKPSRPAQSTLILRLVGGGYLVYLAYQMIGELAASSGSRSLLQLLFMVLFFITGVLLAGWSLKKLLLKEFTRPGETEDGQEN